MRAAVEQAIDSSERRWRLKATPTSEARMEIRQESMASGFNLCVSIRPIKVGVTRKAKKSSTPTARKAAMAASEQSAIKR